MADTKIQECSSPMYIDKTAQYSTTMKQTAQFKKWQEKLNRFFFSPKKTEGQQAHEKMFNITIYQGNANQNQNKISLPICCNGYYQKGKKLRTGKNVEERESSFTKRGICVVTMEKQYGESSKN